MLHERGIRLMRQINRNSDGSTERIVSAQRWMNTKINYTTGRVSIGSMVILASSLEAADGEFLIWTMVARALNSQLRKHESIGTCIEDIAMDVYADVKRAVIDKGGLLAEPWLQVVAHNTASSLVANLFCKTRKSGSATAALRSIPSLDAVDENGEPTMPEPADEGMPDIRRAVQAKEELNIVRRAMRRLPEKYRICMEHIENGLSVAETARKLHMDPSYVGRLVAKARRTLRSALAATPTSGHHEKPACTWPRARG